MELIILRHGEAEAAALSDRQRNLTDYGRYQASRAGEWLAEQGLDVDLCWVSPYPRAQQTAQCVQQSQPEMPLITQSFLTPGASPIAVAEQLPTAQCERLLLVSHNPMVSMLGAYLVGSRDRYATAMGTASMALLRSEDWLPGCCELQWLRHAPEFEHSL